MIIVTFSNWKRKLKILVVAILVGAILCTGYIVFARINPAAVGSAENDRDARGSLKVNASPLLADDSGEEDLLGTIMETLKTFCQQ